MTVTQLIHILHFLIIDNFFYKPTEKKIQRSQLQITRGPGNGYPFSYQTIRKLPDEKGMNTMKEVRWCVI
jgi:hypothetical protein